MIEKEKKKRIYYFIDFYYEMKYIEIQKYR